MYSSIDANWSLLTPEIVLASLALVIFTIDFMTEIKAKKAFLGRLSIAALIITALLVPYTNSKSGSIADVFIVDSLSMVFKLIILVAAAIVVGMSLHYLDKNEAIYQGEFYSLILFSTLGAMLMVSSADFITMMVGIETLSISSYCLAGFKKHKPKSTESAIKYLIFGGVALTFFLYGMSFLYGLTGSTSIAVIGKSIHSLYLDYPIIIITSILLMLAGFGFKISIAPFHMWAPDVYEGAPTPVTAFVATVSKIAGFGLVLRVFYLTFYGIDGEANTVYEDLSIVFAVLAALTMVVGNIAAISQKNVKRLMAYSGVAQAGYLFVPFAVTLSPNDSISIILFYSVAYIMMVLGAFAIITLVTENSGREYLSSFAGLYKRSPFMAAAMTIYLVSLSGLPITAGFIGKAWIFFGAVSGERIWLAVIMVITSIISFYYYFGIVKQMFMCEPNPNDGKFKCPVSISVVVCTTLGITLLLGFLPGLLTNWFSSLNWMSML